MSIEVVLLFNMCFNSKGYSNTGPLNNQTLFVYHVFASEGLEFVVIVVIVIVVIDI